MLFFNNKCQRIKRLLSDRIDAPLSKRSEIKVEKHLKFCEECQKEVDFYSDLSQISKELDYSQPPDYLWERISLKVDEHPWEDEGNSGSKIQFSFLHSYKNSIHLAGVVATIFLVIILTLTPDLSTDMDGNKFQVQAGELDPDVAYVSLFMMSQGDKYPSEVQDYFISQLNGLNEKITYIKSKLESHPHNQEVRLRLAEVYKQKIYIYKRLEIPSKYQLMGNLSPEQIIN